jgi:hypothetical protein
MPEPTALALPGAPCRGCGRPYHWLDLTTAGWCQRCANAVWDRITRARLPVPIVYRGEVVDP